MGSAIGPDPLAVPPLTLTLAVYLLLLTLAAGRGLAASLVLPKAPLPLCCPRSGSRQPSIKHLLLLLIEEFPFVSLSAQRRVGTKP